MIDKIILAILVGLVLYLAFDLIWALVLAFR